MFETLKKLFGFGNGNSGPGDGRGSGGDPGMISCQEALDRLFEYLDGELEGFTREQVAHHFEVCRRCYPRLQFERAFLEAVRRAERGEEAPPHLRERILGFMEEEGLGAG